MDFFNYRDGELHAESVALSTIAQRFGSPTYIYSRAAIEHQWRAFDEAFGELPHLVCYSVKANSNLAVLNILARLGSGFDIVSQGELERVLAAGGDPAKIVFSGVCKQIAEMRRALEVGVHCFNVESEAELQLLNQVAADLGVQAPVSLRVNPDVDAKTHPYISTGLKENKFGVDIAKAEAIYTEAASLPNIRVVGVDCHIGSQLTQLTPFSDALDRVIALIESLAARGIKIHHLDIGGGLGVRYKDENPPSPAEYIEALRARLQKSGLTILVEPGRAIVANAGVLLTQVQLLKSTPAKHFAVIDAAMNDLIRPALYSAWQEIAPVIKRAPSAEYPLVTYDVVGPVCETGDFLGKDRDLSIAPGDYLVVRSAGAYGFSMSSNYNTRNRAAEIIVDGDKFYCVRRRETYADQFALESLLPAVDAAELRVSSELPL